MLREKVEVEMVYYLRAQVLRKALKISRPLPLVSGEAHLLGGPIFSVKSGPVPGFSGGGQNILLHRPVPTPWQGAPPPPPQQVGIPHSRGVPPSRWVPPPPRQDNRWST